jgi:hypothetical protein
MSRQDEQWRCAIHESGDTIAAINFGIPIIRATIEAGDPHVHSGRYHVQDADLGLECMVTLCLAGPEAEREFCGAIDATLWPDRFSNNWEYSKKYSVTQAVYISQNRVHFP